MLEFLNSDPELLRMSYFGLNIEHSENFEKNPISLNTIIKVLFSIMQVDRPKIAWNSCVSLGHIISKDHLRSFGTEALFSDEYFNTYLTILNERPNYKVKIHVTQTLAKYKSYSDYGTKFFEVMQQCLVTFEKSFSESDPSVFKYIQTLQNFLVDLYLHMLECLIELEDSAIRSQEFLTDHLELIKDVFVTYMNNRLNPPALMSPTTSSAGEDTHFDNTKNLINSDSDLKNTLTKIQK